MKPEMITLKVGQATIKLPASVVAQSMLAGVLTQLQTVPAPMLSAHSIPLVGEYWPGQGGINGGLVAAQDGVPAHYLIFATEDAGKHKWGGYEKESAATSKRDGLANTQALLTEGGHPAAEAAAKYSGDGHQDFFLPAAAELYQGWLNVPGIFAQDRWYWSSSQRSAYYAFGMLFAGGLQDGLGKNHELSVRPVRRLFI
jgi:hypothetical protein